MSVIAERAVPSRLGSGFRWLMASSWSSNLGDGLQIAAGPLLMASLTRDPFLVSLAAMLSWSQPLIFGLYAGILSDRLNRRAIVLVADGSRAIVLGVLVVLIATHQLTVGWLLLALAILGAAEVFADNSAMTLTPMLVTKDDLTVANARLQTGFLAFNQLVGPPIGAALFAAGRAWPFLTQAILLAAGVALVSKVRLPAHGLAPDDRRRIRHDLAEGFRWTLHNAAVRTLALTILIFNVTYGAAWSVLVLYAQRRLGLGDIGYGLLSTISAAGGLLGTGLYGWLTRRVSLGNIMRVGLIIETLTHLVLALTTTVWVAGPVFFVFGAHAFIWGTTSMTVRQRAVPTELQGRVGSVNTICVYGGLVVGSLLGGALASHAGITAPFWFAFGGSAVFLALLWGQLTRIAHATTG
jgi:MFS family permease